MAKVKRSVLKNLVKECLVEILMEGLHDDDEVETLQEAALPRSRRTRKSRSNNEMIEKIQTRKKMLNEKIVQKSPVLPKQAEDFMGGVTNDPVMAQIFADTANTTLPKMIANDRASSTGRSSYVPADTAAVAVQDNDLEDLFEGSSNWATLAFSSDKKAH